MAAPTVFSRLLLAINTATAWRAKLGLAIGTDVQAQSARLDEIAALTPTDSNIIVGDGSSWVAESGATARTSLGAAQRGTGVEHTVASGAITLTSFGWITVDTEADAASDTLATIVGGAAGQVIYCTVNNNARITTFQDGVGNLRLVGDFTPGDANDSITLLYNGNWIEISRSIT